MTDRELMQKALEALELLARCEHPLTKIQVRKPRDGGSIVTVYPHQVATDAAEPLRERLAQPQRTHWDGCEAVHPECKQPEQEPVAWMIWTQGPVSTFLKKYEAESEFDRLNRQYPEPSRKLIALYTTPQRREWVGLTDGEVKSLPQWFPSHETAAVLPIIRAVEAKLREKNA